MFFQSLLRQVVISISYILCSVKFSVCVTIALLWLCKKMLLKHKEKILPKKDWRCLLDLSDSNSWRLILKGTYHAFCGIFCCYYLFSVTMSDIYLKHGWSPKILTYVEMLPQLALNTLFFNCFYGGMPINSCLFSTLGPWGVFTCCLRWPFSYLGLDFSSKAYRCIWKVDLANKEGEKVVKSTLVFVIVCWRTLW